MNIMPFAHNQLEIDFDCYRLPTTGVHSSCVDSNFRLRKDTSTFKLDYDSGKALGAGVSFKRAWEVNTAGQMSIGNSSIINTGAQKVMIYGDNNSADGPHIQTFTSADNYPLLQIASFTHNDVSLNFDCYQVLFDLVIQVLIMC